MAENIVNEDCPPGKAPIFPGKKTRNNPGGVELSKSEFTDKVIRDWVKYFANKDKYQNTPWSVRTRYLVRFLKPLGVGMQVAKEKLIKVEKMLAEEADDFEIVDEDMDVEVIPGPESSWYLKDKYIKEGLELSDYELFESGRDIPDYVTDNKNYKKRETEYFLAMSDEELFKRYEHVPVSTRDTEAFKKRQEEYVERYMEDNFAQSSSQEILLKSSQTPVSVQDSETYKKRLSHLSFEEKSEKLVMKNIKETLNELNKTPEGKKQAKIFIAGVSHPVFGDPGLGLSNKLKYQTKQIKAQLLSGENATLKVEDIKKRQIFSSNVEMIAREHWLENTIPEPAKHSGKAVEDCGETIPKRYQDRTDSECYEQFKDSCAGKVRREMMKASEEIISKVTGRKDSADKERRLEYARSLPEKFPGLSWFIKQRPPETKPLCDHTTGLCHICEAARKNFDSLVKAAKRKCSCTKRSCPMWFCACPVPETEDEEVSCSCPPCECDSCSSCQVSYLYIPFQNILM